MVHVGRKNTLIHYKNEAEVVIIFLEGNNQ